MSDFALTRRRSGVGFGFGMGPTGDRPPSGIRISAHVFLHSPLSERGITEATHRSFVLRSFGHGVDQDSGPGNVVGYLSEAAKFANEKNCHARRRRLRLRRSRNRALAGSVPGRWIYPAVSAFHFQIRFALSGLPLRRPPLP